MLRKCWLLALQQTFEGVLVVVHGAIHRFVVQQRRPVGAGRVEAIQRNEFACHVLWRAGRDRVHESPRR